MLTENTFSAGAFLLLALVEDCHYTADVAYGVVFHKPVVYDLRNKICLRALDDYYLKAIERINIFEISEINGEPEEFTIPINRFNINI